MAPSPTSLLQVLLCLQAVVSAVERDRVWQGELAESQAALEGLQASYQQLQQQHQATLAAATVPGSAGGAEAAALRQQAQDLQRQLRLAHSTELRLQGEVERLVQQSAAHQLQLSQQGGQAQGGVSPLGLSTGEGVREEAGISGGVARESLEAALEAAKQAADVAIADRDQARAQLSRSGAVPTVCPCLVRGNGTFARARQESMVDPLQFDFEQYL